MVIRCGNHRGSPEPVYHENVASVRACSMGDNVASANPDAVVGSLDNDPPVIIQEEVTEGMWRLGDKIVKIQIAYHGSGHLYGKELVITGPKPEGGKSPHEWVRLVGAVRMLQTQGGRKMSLEEAVQFGKLYGFCCRCGTILTNEESIEAGIGPVCAGKF